MKYIKYKTQCKLILTGDDDLFSSNSGSYCSPVGHGFS